MTRLEREVLERVLRSRLFVHAESLRRILVFLCRHKERALKEYEIAVDALGRSPDFDPKLDPIVRVSVAAIRERLDSWFGGEGAQEPLRLSVPKGRYQAVFGPCETQRAAPFPQSNVLRRFWAPYLDKTKPVLILWSELLFFRDVCGNYVRNIFVNDIRQGPGALGNILAGASPSEFRPSYHFMSAGEVHCILALMRFFHECGIRAEPCNARFAAWQNLRDANVILIGSSRVNRFVSAMQQEECFRVESREIVNHCAEPGESRVYVGSRTFEGQLERLTEYAVVTRRPGVVPGTYVTMLSGNHGRVMEAAGGFLTMDDKVRTLLKMAGVGEADPVPDRAQFLLRVEMVDFDEEVVSVTPIAHRVGGQPLVRKPSSACK